MHQFLLITYSIRS